MRARRGAERPLRGCVVAITGAARGIGLAAARELSRHGARVALADLDADRARAEAERLPRAQAFAVDVADRDSVAEMLDAVEATLGPLDVLVNNAAVMWLGPFLDEPADVVARQVDVNLTGVLNCSQLALRRMLPRGGGHVVNVASAAGKLGIPGEVVYAATKHAVVGVTETLRAELRHEPVDFTVVLSGPVATELAAGMRASWAIRVVPVDVAARAVVGAIRRPRAEVWVPRELGWAFTLGGLLPRPLRERVQDAIGVNGVAWEVDGVAREPYHRRAFQSADSR